MIRRAFGLFFLICVTLVTSAIGAPRPISSAIELPGKDFSLFLSPGGDLIGAHVAYLRFQEELVFQKFGIEGQSPTKDQALLLDRLGGMVIRSGTEWPTPEETATWVARKELTPKEARFELKDPTGRHLPKGLVVIRGYRLAPEPYHFSFDIELKNETKDILDLSKSPLNLELGPILGGDAYNQPSIFGYKDGFHSVTPKSEIQEFPAGTKWAGGRNIYFALIVHLAQGEGTFTHRALTYKHVVQGSLTATTAPVLGFRPQVSFLKPGDSLRYGFTSYMGPKTESLLGDEHRQVFDNWDAWYGMIGKWMYELLKVFYALTMNYGVSILLLTLLVKLLLHPLTRSQNEGMRKMAELQPKMNELRETYKDNAEILNREMMRLYKVHNVNPLAGCMPMLMQIPIFISLYNCIRYAIELKNVPFWWLPDLTQPDPQLILPVTFALTIYYSSKAMQPSNPGDDNPAGMMKWMMPILMFFMMMQVSSGVLLYLCGQSILGILEQKMTKGQGPIAASAPPPQSGS